MRVIQIHLDMLLKQFVSHTGQFFKSIVSHLVQISSAVALYQHSHAFTLESKFRKSLQINLICFLGVTLNFLEFAGLCYLAA